MQVLMRDDTVHEVEYVRLSEARAEIASAVAAERDRWKAAMRLLHDYQGACPDAQQPEARDPECKACTALLELGA